ncbi:MAG: hypothetical protein IKO05_11950 [Selenomonadaceae bacterium]|nr:hypothetical protein [Selenomonadaceae bacterium]
MEIQTVKIETVQDLDNFVSATMDALDFKGITTFKSADGIITYVSGNAPQISDCLLELLALLRNNIPRNDYQYVLYILRLWLEYKSEEYEPADASNIVTAKAD